MTGSCWIRWGPGRSLGMVLRHDASHSRWPSIHHSADRRKPSTRYPSSQNRTLPQNRHGAEPLPGQPPLQARPATASTPRGAPGISHVPEAQASARPHVGSRCRSPCCLAQIERASSGPETVEDAPYRHMPGLVRHVSAEPMCLLRPVSGRWPLAVTPGSDQPTISGNFSHQRAVTAPTSYCWTVPTVRTTCSAYAYLLPESAV